MQPFSRAFLLAALAAALAGPAVRADEPPRPAPTPAELARRLRSADAGERALALGALRTAEPRALRDVLALARGQGGDAQAWAQALLPLARASEEPRRREWVRALLEARAEARAARPQPAPKPDPVPFGEGFTLDLLLVQARGEALRALRGPALGGPARVLDAAALERALATPGEGSSAERLGAPTLALVGSTEASVDLTRERTYVERYEVTAGRGGHPVVSPVVDTCAEGIRCRAAVARTAGASTTFRVHVDLVEVAEPLDEFDAPLALPGRSDELTVRVQVPDVRSERIQRDLVLVKDLWSVVGSVDPPLSKAAGAIVLLARATAVPGPR